FLKCISCRAGHIVAVQIMYLVMTNRSAFPVKVMIKASVILGIVRQLHDQTLKSEMCHQILVLSAEAFQLIKNFLQTLFGIEDGRLVHIIPESIDSLIQQEFVLQSEPAARL